MGSCLKSKIPSLISSVKFEAWSCPGGLTAQSKGTETRTGDVIGSWGWGAQRLWEQRPKGSIVMLKSVFLQAGVGAARDQEARSRVGSHDVGDMEGGHVIQDLWTRIKKEFIPCKQHAPQPIFIASPVCTRFCFSTKDNVANKTEKVPTSWS